VSAKGGDQRAGRVDFPFVKLGITVSVESHGSPIARITEETFTSLQQTLRPQNTPSP
jgi:hypothetical protein